MPILIQRSDDPGELLCEVNHCHGPGRGHPCVGRAADDKTGATSTATATAGTSYARPKVLQVRSIEQALRLIAEGKTVELPDTRAVNTLLDKLAKIAIDAESKGQDAPFYDLCKVTVKGSNLFCSERLRTEKHPEGIPRAKMPQLSGVPVPGSPADKLPKNKKGEVDVSKAFLAHLESLGIRVTKASEPAAKLKATQAQLVGVKVAGMMSNPNFDPRGARIFVSRDHYVIDGHHRWAAAVGRDAKDGRLGDEEMRVRRVDAPISEILHIANQFTKRIGIQVKSGSHNVVKKSKAA